MVPEVPEATVQQVLDAAQAYDDMSPYYDDIFNATGQRLRDQGYATKLDVAAVTFWKAINLSTPWVRTFVHTDPRSVREATTKAFLPGLGDKDRLKALEQLPGFRSWYGRPGGAIPSTLLCCWDPENYAVTDERAREGLALVGMNANGLLEYWKAVRSLRDSARRLRPSISARDIDKALFKLAGDKKRR